jgi:hypothetical protein
MVVHPRVRTTVQVPGISGALPGTPIARKYPVVIRRSTAPPCLPLLAVLLSTVLAAPASAASKATVAYLGQAAPEGGLFAGPSFVGEPSAAGNGWIAFRAQVVGSTSEQIIVSNFVSPQRTVVASVGGTISKDIGTVKQFLGRPTVNAHGDVVFAALTTPPAGVKIDPTAPAPGGIFLYSQGALTAVAAPGLDTGFGILDLTTQINFNDDFSSLDISERTPALNDNGDVAFVAATQTSTGTSGGAVFVRHAGQTLIAPVIKLNDAYGAGTFQVLGPPALNNSGTLAFHGFVDGGETIDGIFQLQGGALSLLFRDGVTPAQFPATFVAGPLGATFFDDVVALNDAGDVAFTGGPLTDLSPNSTSTADSSGVVVIHAGTPVLVGFPGEPIGGVAAAIAKVSSINLGPAQGSIVAPPALLPDGKVVFFAQINGGSAQMILRADPVAQTLTALVTLGGSAASATPAGGTYDSATSAPAVDTAGAVTFTASIDGATTSEALIWDPPTGAPQTILIGDAVPEPANGFFGGPPFFPPKLNDAGDVVFKSYVAKGPALGIFRYSQGSLQALVRIQDAAPLPPAKGATAPPRFTNLVGDPSLNASGDIAFAATVEGGARGVFATTGGTLRSVAMPLDPLQPEDISRPAAFFRNIAANPALGDSGSVAFRGQLQYANPIDPIFLPDIRENCIFLADQSGIHVIAAQGDDSGVPGQPPLFAFHDPSIMGNQVSFRANLGIATAGPNGIFVADSTGVRAVAIEQQPLSSMTVNTISGQPDFDGSGDVFFSAKVTLPDKTSQGVILRQAPNVVQTVAQTGVAGPEGGIIRGLSRLSTSSSGDVAFRANYQALSGGVSGLLLANSTGLHSYLRTGEGGGPDVGGRITSFSPNVSVNSSDQVALLATVGGAQNDRDSAIFLAAPSTLSVRNLVIKRGRPKRSAILSGKPHDGIRLTAVLKPGNLPQPPDAKKGKLGRQLVAVGVADTQGTLWSAVMPASQIGLSGQTLVAKGDARKKVRGLRVRAAKDGTIRLTVRSVPINLTSTSTGLHNFDSNGALIIAPPLSVRIDVGGTGGSVVPCMLQGRRYVCGG